MAVDIASSISGAGGQLMSTAINIVVGLIGACILGVMGYFVVSKKKYNIEVTIHSLRNGGNKIIKDVGSIVTAKGVDAIHLKTMKCYIPLPNLECFETGVGGKTYLSLYQKSNKIFLPLKPYLKVKDDKASLEMEQQDQNMLAWYQNAEGLIRRTVGFSDFMQKYGAIVGLLVVVGGAIVIIAMTVQQVSPLIGQLGSIASSLNNVADKLALSCSGSVAESGSVPW